MDRAVKMELHLDFNSIRYGLFESCGHEGAFAKKGPKTISTETRLEDAHRIHLGLKYMKTELPVVLVSARGKRRITYLYKLNVDKSAERK